MTQQLAAQDALRRSILSSVPAEASQYSVGEPRFLYLPKSHARALDPDNMLVVGMRGAGKSFWWHALQSEQQKGAIEAAYHDGKAARVLKNDVSAGFSEQLSADYPSRDAIQRIITTHSPRLLWRTVVLWAVAPPEVTLASWMDRVGWVAAHPEEVDQSFRHADEALSRRNRRHLVLFDALDRTSESWRERRHILQGLLQILLELRATSSIRAKAFVRPDHLVDPEVTSFPDASKVVSTQVTLDWPRTELYGLLWQYLGNADEGSESFREQSGKLAVSGWRCVNDIWQIPESLRFNEAIQQQVFELLAAPYMGKDRRRSISYRWLPSHLADGFSKVSPRSFLSAIREAAADETHPQQGVPLHWESIKLGVQRASKIRVAELAEDHPWTNAVMEALRGLQVPAAKSEIASIWKRTKVLESIEAGPEAARPRDLTPSGIMQELQTIGIFQELDERRLNIPDVFRVGFGILRKGGVKALK
jgi:hypothetical protein